MTVQSQSQSPIYNYATAMAWSPNGSSLAIATIDSHGAGSYGNIQLKIVEPENGSTRIVFQEVEGGVIRHLFWTADSHHVILGNNFNQIHRVDAVTGMMTQSFEIPFSSWEIESMSVDFTGQFLAVSDDKVQIIDLISESVVQMIPVDQPVTWVGWSPIQQFLAIACGDGTILVWNFPLSRIERSLGQHGTAISRSGSWSSDGTHLAVAYSDTTVSIWNVMNGIEETSFSESMFINEMRWNPAGEALAIAGPNTVNIWNVVVAERVLTISDIMLSDTFAWSPHGTQIAVSEYRYDPGELNFRVVTPPAVVIPSNPTGHRSSDGTGC